MKRSIFAFSLCVCSVAAFGQTSTSTSQAPVPQPQPNIPASQQLKVRGPDAVAQADPNKVVAVINGKNITAKEADELLKSVRAEDRRRFESNLSGLLQQVYMQRQLADQAAQLKLDEQSPWKEQLEMARAGILAQAYLTRLTNNASTSAPTQDPKQVYDAHPDDYAQYKISGILIAFTPPGTPASSGGVSRTEVEARAKADDLEKKLKSGGDFATLARSDSDNQTTAAKGGDMGSFLIGETGIPADIKNALTKLQPGQISDPIRVNIGFYIMKVDSIKKLTFDEAKPQIVQKLQTERNQTLVREELDKYKVTVQDPDFFTSASGARIPSLARPSGTAGNAASPSTPPTTTPQAK